MNKPNILSNDKDQVAKNTNTRYQARIDAMSNEIIKAFDRNIKDMILKNQWIGIDTNWNKSILDWLHCNKDKLPLDRLLALRDNETISLELKREKSWASRGGWNQAIGFPVEPSTLSALRGHILTKNENKLNPGEIWTYLVIQKKPSKPWFEANKDYKITMEQIEVPGENTLLSKEFIFHKELKGEEVDQIIMD